MVQSPSEDSIDKNNVTNYCTEGTWNKWIPLLMVGWGGLRGQGQEQKEEEEEVQEEQVQEEQVQEEHENGQVKEVKVQDHPAPAWMSSKSRRMSKRSRCSRSRLT